jgi:hypothetical protein
MNTASTKTINTHEWMKFFLMVCGMPPVNSEPSCSPALGSFSEVSYKYLSGLATNNLTITEIHSNLVQNLNTSDD